MSRKRAWLLVIVPALLLALAAVFGRPSRSVTTDLRQEKLFAVDDVPDNIVIDKERNSLRITLQIGDFMRQTEIVGPDFRSMTADQVKQVYANQMNVWLTEYNTLIARGEVKRSSSTPVQ